MLALLGHMLLPSCRIYPLTYLLCFYFSSQLSHTNVQVKLEPQEEGSLDLSDLSS